MHLLLYPFNPSLFFFASAADGLLSLSAHNDSIMFVCIAGCPVPGNPYLFGCIGSNDDGAESYEPPLWQCGDRARVEVPLVSAPRNAYSASNRFLIGVSPYFDVTPGVTRVQVSWNWVPPASQTPSPSASPSTTASASQSLSYLASPSGSPSNSPSNSASGSPTGSDTPSMSITPSASRTVSPTRTKTINSSVSKTPVREPYFSIATLFFHANLNSKLSNACLNQCYVLFFFRRR